MSTSSFAPCGSSDKRGVHQSREPNERDFHAANLSKELLASAIKLGTSSQELRNKEFRITRNSSARG